MHKLAVAATITFGALLASAPVQALNGQVKKDGKCFIPAHSHSRDLGFGHWGDCAQAASMRNGVPVPLAAPTSADAAKASSIPNYTNKPTSTKLVAPNRTRVYGVDQQGKRVNPDEVPPLSPGGQGRSAEGR
jgi:hypothetical protein